MSKRKMCKYVDKDRGCNATKDTYLKSGNCPMYWRTTVNCEMLKKYSRCEIVPRKAKPKYKRVKAWALITGMGSVWALSIKGDKFRTIPCTILIEAKWLKGRKGL